MPFIRAGVSFSRARQEAPAHSAARSPRRAAFSANPEPALLPRQARQAGHARSPARLVLPGCCAPGCCAPGCRPHHRLGEASLTQHWNPEPALEPRAGPRIPSRPENPEPALERRTGRHRARFRALVTAGSPAPLKMPQDRAERPGLAPSVRGPTPRHSSARFPAAGGRTATARRTARRTSGPARPPQCRSPHTFAHSAHLAAT